MSFRNQECHRPKPGHHENFVKKNVSIATKNTRSTGTSTQTGFTNVIFSVICQVHVANIFSAQ